MGEKIEGLIEVLEWLPECLVPLILIALAGWWSIAGLKSFSSHQGNSVSLTPTRVA